ncbi:MAG: hypothetical protein U0Z53_01520 [Blastocatellia bacterium]
MKQQNLLKLMMFFLFVTNTGFNLAQPVVTARFGGECQGEKILISKPLSKLIQGQKLRTEISCNDSSCDDVFVHDLNGDKRPEYFIRLNCGATGNCTWGVFSDRPAKMQGQFSAWFFYLHKTKDRWARISTYTRIGGDSGVIGKLTYHQGQYRVQSKRVENGTFNNPQPYLKKMGVPKCN